ncbi:MAG: PDZ domain-containing protein [Gemmatimonadota bacterium]|nr:PDZ domain-containing protein [Gemmatimonadota bacterium]
MPRSLELLLAVPIAAALGCTTLASQPASDAARARPLSAPIADVEYTVTVDSAHAREHILRVAMRFSAGGATPVILSLPAWTPGAYEIAYYSRWVTNFTATSGGKPLHWDRVGYDSWRIDSAGSAPVIVSFDFLADSLDNAMAWSRRDFVFFNGTNLFLYPAGRSLDYSSTVRIDAPPGWRIATGMTPASSPGRFTAGSYHDLVDMPFFIGRFDLDSVRIADRWVRLASYPAGVLAGENRARQWEWMKKVIPPEIAVFQDTPWKSYTVLEVADSSSTGASGLEHQSSQLDVIPPFFFDSPQIATFLAHELFHSWNVKRLRPAELWPYQYAREQPTPWLWVSEGITDYYADLAAVRGGAIDSSAFFELTAEKIAEVARARPVALTEASLATWVHPVDGTALIYYPKGSLAGLLLDVLIRDASGNRQSLDDVLRQLYRDSYKQGRGFDGAEWWRAISAAAGGRSFAEVNARYVEGREPYPWTELLPLAGMRLAIDTLREPLFGVSMLADSAVVASVDPRGAAAEAGVRAGDQLLSIGGIAIADPGFAQKFRAAFATQEGAPLAIRVRRSGQPLSLVGRVKLITRLRTLITADPAASPRATMIRTGILRGLTSH